MGLWTHIRTENQFGPYLSKIFQSFVHGPDIDGEQCELKQIEQLLKLDLNSFMTWNISGLWDTSDFPGNPEERLRLIAQQIESDKTWNDLDDFLVLVLKLITATKAQLLAGDKLKHERDWWNGYFEFPANPNSSRDTFVQDLEIIATFLSDAKKSGDHKAAFYLH